MRFTNHHDTYPMSKVVFGFRVMAMFYLKHWTFKKISISVLISYNSSESVCYLLSCKNDHPKLTSTISLYYTYAEIIYTPTHFYDFKHFFIFLKSWWSFLNFTGTVQNHCSKSHLEKSYCKKILRQGSDIVISKL